MHSEISLTFEGRVAVLEIDRPPHNHVSVALVRNLADTFDALSDDPRCRVILLRSAGKNFCAGADRVNLEQGALRMDGGGNALYAQAARLFACKKPIVAAVQGAAVGAGLGLALMADFRVASADARFTANFVKLGFHPGFGVTHTLPRLIGEQRAAFLCLTGRRIAADQALAWGLVDEIAAREGLAPAAMRLASEIAENAPLGVQLTRATLRRGLAAAVEAQMDLEFSEQKRLFGTSDFAEGVRAVFERRPARFIGA